MSKDSHWAILNSIPLGFRTAPVLAALAKFKAPNPGGMFETEIDGLICHFDRSDDELLLNAVYANGLEIDVENFTMNYRTRLMEHAYIDRQADFEYQRECEAEARFEARMEAREES